jgi:hypothetical protein
LKQPVHDRQQERQGLARISVGAGNQIYTVQNP